MKNKFGLVLGGGGAKGAYQIGALKAINEFNIDFIGYSGSSIGGINEAFVKAIGIDSSLELWKNINFNDFFNIDDNPFDGLSSREGLENLLNKIDYNKLRDINIPIFVTICTNETYKTGKYVILNNKTDKEIKNLLLATSALPYIYSKVLINNNNCIDGGIFDNNPITPLYENNIKDIILIPLSDKYELPYEYKYNKDIIVIKPTMDLKDFIEGTLNFNHLEILMRIDLGYSDAKRVMNNYFGIQNEHSIEYDHQLILQKYKINKIQSKIDKDMEYIKKYI